MNNKPTQDPDEPIKPLYSGPLLYKSKLRRKWRKVLKYIAAVIAVLIALYYALNTGPDMDQRDGATAEPTTMIPKAHLKLNPFKTHRLTT